MMLLPLFHRRPRSKYGVCGVFPQGTIARRPPASHALGLACTRPLADRPLPRAWPPVAIGLLASLLTALPTRAAEQVNVTFGPLAQSIPISSLEAFVKEGTVDAALRPFIRFLKPEAREELRQALGQHKSISASVLSQLLQDPMGEMMLQRTGRAVQTSAGLNGAQAIRSALVLAAAEPEGISLLSFLRHFPTQAVRLDVNRILTIYRQSARFVRQTQAFVATTQQMSAAAAAAEASVPFNNLADLRQPGPYPVVFQPLQLEDTRRQRTYPADLYLPQTLSQLTAVPVVLISHGLGSSRTYFREFAQHLASYGFAVALPEHIGSNEAQKQAVMAWKARETFLVSEFLDRPLDISFLLDQLERYNRAELGGRLDLQRVAVAGHSFGGYTALALGGATIDFDYLANRCQPTTIVATDLALLLECRALELQDSPQVVEQLGVQGVKDDRIKLIMAFAPVSNLFGETGMGRVQVPTLMLGGAFDVAAPLIPQQAETFSWLTTPDRYLVIAEGASHTSDLTQLADQLFFSTVETEATFEASHAWFQGNLRTLLVAAAAAYLKQQPAFETYLRSGYINAISRDPFQLSLIRSLSPEQLAQILRSTR